jgi:hypothetical protein
MSTAHKNANTDLDWVQAPPQASYHDKKNRRKNSNTGYTKKYTNGSNDYHRGSRAGKYSKYNKNYQKGKYSFRKRNNGPYNHYKGYQSRYDEMSTDVSEGYSPDRISKRSCINMRVEVLGEVVIDKINPKFNRARRRNNRFAAACELKAPEPTEIAPPKFL